MSVYQHGIISSEKQTQVSMAEIVESAVGVVIGTAPINLASDPYRVTNEAKLIEDYDSAVSTFGYSTDFSKYTLCQSIFARFIKYKCAPVVFINVLDPKKHVKSVTDSQVSISSGNAIIADKGILIDTIVVKSEDGVTTYTNVDDYLASFNEDGSVIISIASDGTIKSDTVKISYSALDPSKVKSEDIIGGYDVATGKRSGVECITSVVNKFGKIPSHILAPGWSHIPVIASALNSKAKLINGLFNAIAIVDISTTSVTTISDLHDYKIDNGYNDKFNLSCYPKVLSGDYELYMSAMVDCVIAATDAEYEGPYASPSNKNLMISGLCKEGGESVELTIDDANEINSVGIMTALNMNGFRTWGNEMSCYPENKDVKDRFIVCRRVYNYQDNMFKQKFFEEVDNPTNYKLIEYVVNAENKILSSLAATGKIAGGSLEFIASRNPTEQILDGHIVFNRKLSPFTPAKVIETETEFDPTLNLKALGGE